MLRAYTVMLAVSTMPFGVDRGRPLMLAETNHTVALPHAWFLPLWLTPLRRYTASQPPSPAYTKQYLNVYSRKYPRTYSSRKYSRNYLEMYLGKDSRTYWVGYNSIRMKPFKLLPMPQ